LVLFLADTPILVQDVAGQGATEIGAMNQLGVGALPPELTHEWARAIYEDRPASPDVCGIHYHSSFAGTDNIALWDTAPDLVVQLDSPICDQLPMFMAATDELGLIVTEVPEESCEVCLDHGVIDPAAFVKAN
jgi:hypothetical protein